MNNPPNVTAAHGFAAAAATPVHVAPTSADHMVRVTPAEATATTIVVDSSQATDDQSAVGTPVPSVHVSPSTLPRMAASVPTATKQSGETSPT